MGIEKDLLNYLFFSSLFGELMHYELRRTDMEKVDFTMIFHFMRRVLRRRHQTMDKVSLISFSDTMPIENDSKQNDS